MHRRTHHPGYDFVHTAIDDHSRRADAEIHTEEQGATCARFLARAAAYFAGHGIGSIERVLTDNAFGHRRATAFRAAMTPLDE